MAIAPDGTRLDGMRIDKMRCFDWRVIEWRARRLRDPVARLQFLQQQTIANPHRRPSARKKVRHWRVPTIMFCLALSGAALLRPWASSPHRDRAAQPHPASRAASYRAASVPAVWLVETSQRSDLYSNGLRVENQFVTETAPRKYLAFARSSAGVADGEWQSDPAGIVFHTTESHIAPFEEEQNRELRRDGEGLLEYVSRRHSYHFVIDRFGRVFRIVKEADYANHAGNSVWADDQRIYLNLNQSFFGVAFEAQSGPDGTEPPVNPAQVHAGRILVEMLRARYAIPARNCVAHGQVSVNPANGRAGYHIDWAANLPFADLGLSNNYAEPLASVMLFGFEPDAALVDAGGAALAEGIERARDELRSEAAARGVPLARYQAVLQGQYRRAVERQRDEADARKHNSVE